ncbi:MAG: Gfo/Idh/MocA family oxidoreductase [Candidatus Omnitrophica bacterium]|nr:Gfo/Idh/MocA family oxidoreductase [Candidatus Omnitrophota bacterium]
MNVQTKPLRVGIIGLGVGQAHAEAFAKHPGCAVVALCDFAAKKQDWAREHYPQVKVTAKAEEILTAPAIDVVSICSYDDMHYEQIMLAIKHDKHIFVEKPLCLKPRMPGPYGTP